LIISTIEAQMVSWRGPGGPHRRQRDPGQPAKGAEEDCAGASLRFSPGHCTARAGIDAVGATLVTTDTAAKEVKLFGLGGFFTERFRLLGQVFYTRVRRLAVRRSLVSGGWGMLGPLVGSLTYLYIALQAVAGRLTLGDLTLYPQATNSVQNGIQQVFSSFSTLYENALYMDNLDELLAAVPVVVAPAEPVALPSPVRGHIVFEHLTFRCPGTQIRVLDDVSVEIHPGETVALADRNGAGESTFVKLLCRLYDPDEGRILLDGIDITTVDPAGPRAAIGGMFQDFVTYQATAGENIGPR